MSDVMMTVAHQRPVGAFMTALSRIDEGNRPKTVEGFMRLLAGYLNAHFLDATTQVDIRKMAPDIEPGLADYPGEAEADFVPDTASDTSDGAMGRWLVHPYFEMAHVKKNAMLELRQHTPDHVIVRLPQKALLADAEHEARLLSVAGDTDKFTGPSYYYNYFGQSADMTTMEYLWSRIADYTTASCR